MKNQMKFEYFLVLAELEAFTGKENNQRRWERNLHIP